MANVTHDFIWSGGNGFTLITGTAATTPPSNSAAFWGIQAVGGANAVINNSGTTCGNAVGFNTTITLGAGEILRGNFTQITLSSGAAVAYHR